MVELQHLAGRKLPISARLSLVFVLSISAVSCDSAHPDAGVAAVQDSAGVLLRSNAAHESRLLGPPLARLGQAGEDFGRITGAVFLSDSTIAIVDQYADAVGIWSLSGAKLGQFAPRGDGPGELRSVSAIVRAGAENVVVADMGAVRAEFFDRNGAYTSSARRGWAGMAQRAALQACCTLRGAFPDGALLFSTPDILGAPAELPTRAEQVLLVWNPPQGGAPDSVTAVGSGDFLPAPSGSGRSRLEPHFNPKALAAVSGDVLVVSNGRERIISLLDREGDLVGRSVVVARGEAVSDDIENVVTGRIENTIRRLGAERAEAAGLTFQSLRPFPDSLPAYNTIIASPSRIVAGLVLDESFGLEPRFDIFDGGGDYLGTVRLPLGSSILDVRGELLLVRRSGPMGVPIVEIHRWTVG